MPITRKPDSEEIKAFLDELKRQDWISGERSWWPQYVFHFTSIENAVQILKNGELRCRSALEKSGYKFKDAASPEIIAQTSAEVKDYVRLYFRPRTPTQYRMEGIRPKGREEYGGAHCPVPIFFLFRAADVLTRSDCEFTNGNSASMLAKRDSSADFLKGLPFKKIYHNTWLDPLTKSEIIFHRNAEVIIPYRLDLSALSAIVCRSPAEKDTLFALLPEEVKKQYQNHIGVAQKQLHEKKWTFVETVTLEDDRVIIHFSPDSLMPGPFLAKFELHSPETEPLSLEIAGFTIGKSSNPFTVNLPFPLQYYCCKLTLDDHLAYQGNYEPLPF